MGERDQIKRDQIAEIKRLTHENTKLYYELNCHKKEQNELKDQVQKLNKDIQDHNIYRYNVEKEGKSRAKEKELYGKLLNESAADKVNHANDMAAKEKRIENLLEEKLGVEQRLARAAEEATKCRKEAENAAKAKKDAETKNKDLQFKVDQLTSSQNNSKRTEVVLRESLDFKKAEVKEAVTRCEEEAAGRAEAQKKVREIESALQET